MPEPSLPSPFEYAIIRVVPWVERGEYINAGAILYCRQQRFLAARIELNPTRLLALFPQANLSLIQSQLDLIPQICNGAGFIGQLSQSERFNWLVSPRSTIIQLSSVHTGLCTNPTAMLKHLLETMIL